MATITVTHYTQGSGVPFYPPLGEEHLSVANALADMFNRLRAGASITYSGFNYGLLTCVGPEDNPTGSDRAIYGGLSPMLQKFIARATDWFEQGEEMQPDSPEHERFIRRVLLESIGLSNLSSEQMHFALSIMPQGDFFDAVAMAIETGENVSELFR